MAWQFKCNIKGADGTTGIPDPLPVTEIDFGERARMKLVTDGVSIEVKDRSDVWHEEAKWERM